MLKKFIVQSSNFFLIGSSHSKLISSFFSITKIYFVFFDKISFQKIVLQIPSCVYLFFLSKKSFFVYNPFFFSKQSFFFQKLSFFFKTTSNFLQKFFVFKVYIKGIGFKFELYKNFIKLFIGFSHSIYIYVPNVVFKQTDSQSFFISGFNKQLLGEFSARIVSFKKPDPYKNKGVFFINLAKEKITKTIVFKTNFQKKNKLIYFNYVVLF